MEQGPFGSPQDRPHPPFQAWSYNEAVSDTTTSSTFEALGAGSLDIEKMSDETKLVVFMSMQWFRSSGNSDGSIGVQIDGTDYLVASQNVGLTSSRYAVAGVLVIEDIPAGIYTVYPRWKRTGATWTAADYLNLTVLEAA